MELIELGFLTFSSSFNWSQYVNIEIYYGL